MGATRVKLDFVVETADDKLLSSFNVNDFIEAGLSRVKLIGGKKVTTIRGGAKLSLTKQRK